MDTLNTEIDVSTILKIAKEIAGHVVRPLRKSLPGITATPSFSRPGFIDIKFCLEEPRSFTDADRTVVRDFVTNRKFLKYARKKLGWKSVRVTTCSRNRDKHRYTWTIEKRS